MKRSAFFIITVMVSMAAYAQPSNVVSAWNYLKAGELDKAKEMIDPAINHDKTKTWAKTWYYRGLIYQSISGSKQFKQLDPNALTVAYESYKKSIELDPKSDYVDDINKIQMKRLMLQLFSAGIELFNNKKFDEALNYFSVVLAIDPNDTVAVLNSAVTATRANNNAKAKEYYNRLIDMKYNDSKIYNSLANIYLMEKDTAKSFETIQKGRKQFPNDNDLLSKELFYLISANKTNEAIDGLNTILAKEPKNSTMWFALGNVYDKLSSDDFKSNKTADHDAHFAKAEEAYKKAIEIKADYFEANFNLGAMYYNLAADMIKKANDIDAIKLKEYNEAKAKFEIQLKNARPYLEKALELQPKDEGALSSLRQLYAHLGETDKSNEMKKRMEGK